MWQYNYTDELYHYGVPGMRWGHRNRQIKEARANLSKLEKEYDNAWRERTRVENEIRSKSKNVNMFELSVARDMEKKGLRWESEEGQRAYKQYKRLEEDGTWSRFEKAEQKTQNALKELQSATDLASKRTVGEKIAMGLSITGIAGVLVAAPIYNALKKSNNNMPKRKHFNPIQLYKMKKMNK